jgi:putative MATE family efflux protein
MVVSSSLNMLGPTIDMIWMGKLGSTAIAAVGVAGIGVQLLMSAVMGLAMGMRAMIARFIGAQDPESANQVALQAFVVSAVVSVIMAMVGLFLAESIMRLFPLEEEVILQGAIYLKIVFMGGIVMVVRMMCEGAMQSAGDAVTPMWIGILFRFFHVVLCPFLVLGWWIFPQLGVSGAAFTNIISQGIGLGLSLWVLFTGRSIYFDSVRKMVRLGRARMKLTLDNFRVDPGIIWRIVRIGVPSSIMGMQMALAGFFFIRIMAPYGTFAVAAHTISQRVEMILFMPVMGLGMAAGTLAGQNLGAGQPERAERGGWLAATVALALMAVCCLALLLGAEGIVGIFNSESDLLTMGSKFLRIGAAGFFLIGFVIVLQFCISGAGDTIPPMVISLLMMWLIQLPLAYVLPRYTDLGVYGVRWAMVISIGAGTIAYSTYFKLGRWKRKRV